MVDAGPEIEAHHHGHTGHRWLDILLGVSAMIVSVVSLVVALHHGETMEKMVEASTWPYVAFTFSNANLDATPRAALTVVNSGVGPARIETVEIFYEGKPMASRQALIAATTGDPALKTLTSTIGDRVLTANQTLDFMSMSPETVPPAQFARFRDALPGISARICYCSVLDQCWLRAGRQSKPEKVKVCPKPVVAYAG
jgi:hypothetical protein